MKKRWAYLAWSAWFCGALPLPGQVFWSEDFSGGAIPAGWENQDVSSNGVLWGVCADPFGCPAGSLFPVPMRPFASSTAADGFAFINSNFHGTITGGHLSRLTTPPIDCSQQQQVFLQFQAAIGTSRFNAAQNALLRVITPEGQQVFSLFPMLDRNNQQQFAPVKKLAGGKAYYITLDLSELAAGQDSVFLQWEWRGNREFAWCIDDIVLSAQNPARPAGALWFESFSGGAGGWSSNPLSLADSNWLWTAAGDVSNSVSSIAFGDQIFIHSPTGNDGAMAFNADFFSTGGVDVLGPFPDYVCELVSPPIDLSGTDKPVALQLSQLVWLGDTAEDAPQSSEAAKFITSFAYSANGGQTWSEPINVNPYQTPATSSNVFLMPPANNQAYFALPGAEGSNDFRLKFTWAGKLYFWVLDDIAIVERPPLDMKANRDFFALPPNAITPRGQLEDVPLLADVLNHGGQPAQEVHLEAAVIRNSNGETIYQDELFYGDIPVDSLVENVLFSALLPAGSLQQPGEYRGYYAVSHSQPDDRPLDDTLKWRFAVSDTTFAKELGPTFDIVPSAAVRYALGNCFYVPRGQGQYARYISFAVGNALRLANIGASVDVLLHKWQGDLNGDGKADPQEYANLAFNTYVFQGNEGSSLITLPISFEQEGVPLEDDAYYLAVVSYDGLFEPLFMLASDTIDYQATIFAHQQIGRKQYASVLDENLTGDFSLLGFGYNIVPVVRLHIGGSPLLSAPSVPPSARAEIKLSPNPAAGQVRIELPTDVPLDSAALEVVDMSGSIVFAKKLGRFPPKALIFDAHYLPVGAYSVRLSGPGLTASALLMIQR